MKAVNRLMKSWLEKNAEDMYSTLSEGKSFIVERFITTLMSKIYYSWLQFRKMLVFINQMILLINAIIQIIAQLK